MFGAGTIGRADASRSCSPVRRPVNTETFTNDQETYRRFTSEPFSQAATSLEPWSELHVRIAAGTGSVTVFLGNEIHSPRDGGRIARWNCSLSDLEQFVAEVAELIAIHEKTGRSGPAGLEQSASASTRRSKAIQASSLAGYSRRAQ